MPEEIAIIAVVAIIGGTLSAIVKHVLEYLKSREPRSVERSSMTTSELQALLRSSVMEATEPLAARLEKLEQKVESVSADRKDLLKDIESYDAPEREREPSALRSRS